MGLSKCLIHHPLGAPPVNKAGSATAPLTKATFQRWGQCRFFYNGSDVPQGHNRQTIHLAQKWVKNGFGVIGWKWPKKWVQSGFRGLCGEEEGPETHFGPTLGPLPANDEEPIFDPLLCQINCLTILALRDLRAITAPLESGMWFTALHFERLS